MVDFRGRDFSLSACSSPAAQAYCTAHTCAQCSMLKCPRDLLFAKIKANLVAVRALVPGVPAYGKQLYLFGGVPKKGIYRNKKTRMGVV